MSSTLKENIVLQNVSFPSVIFVVISKYNQSWRSYNLHLLIYVNIYYILAFSNMYNIYIYILY